MTATDQVITAEEPGRFPRNGAGPQPPRPCPTCGHDLRTNPWGQPCGVTYLAGRCQCSHGREGSL